ncbi:hypothetical protein B0H16DRAFT_1560264 [Mycena metata]|uniref:Uncharacterized protein n=1 Tax=Mycena metata TaxID=1033252 RepID=A0AAD7IIV2_9AGAR|nr:hypothetical protein B0H16DRAFT_1560264 [Mycena metata]
MRNTFLRLPTYMLDNLQIWANLCGRTTGHLLTITVEPQFWLVSADSSWAGSTSFEEHLSLIVRLESLIQLLTRPSISVALVLTHPQHFAAMQDEEIHPNLEARLVARSQSTDWLSQMIQAVRTIAAGADFVALPYVKTALGTIVVLLETVDKLKKNREDLRDLCASTVEILLILRNEICTNGGALGVRFAGLCEDYIAFLSILRRGLENLI